MLVGSTVAADSSIEEESIEGVRDEIDEEAHAVDDSATKEPAVGGRANRFVFHTVGAVAANGCLVALAVVGQNASQLSVIAARKQRRTKSSRRAGARSQEILRFE